VTLGESHVVGEQAVVKVAGRPQHTVGQVVELVGGRYREDRASIGPFGELAAHRSGLEPVDPRLSALLHPEQHRPVRSAQKLLEARHVTYIDHDVPVLVPGG